MTDSLTFRRQTEAKYARALSISDGNVSAKRDFPSYFACFYEFSLANSFTRRFATVATRSRIFGHFPSETAFVAIV